MEQDNYTLRGSVKNAEGKPIKAVKIQLMDSDQEAFQDTNDDIIATIPVNDSDGTFEVTFDSKMFKDGWLEGHPDLYLLIRDALDGQVIYRTEVRRGLKPNSDDLIFDITVDSLEQEYGGDRDNNKNNNSSRLYDPFEGNNDRVVAAFTRLGDVVQFVPSDIQRNLALIISSINAWTFYTREDMWRKIDYDGPQVSRYPWREEMHSHRLSWEKVQQS